MTTNHKHRLLQRQRVLMGDFYATPAPITEALLTVEKFEGSIWEPCCGRGHISQVLEAHGYEVRSSDLFADRHGFGEQLDFLKSTDKTDNIITNPPYVQNLSLRFLSHALLLYRRKIAFLLPLTFLETPRRRRLLRVSPLKVVYLFSRRVWTLRFGREDFPSSKFCFAWFVWEKGWTAEPVIRWLD